jgi:hypothetical protein
MTFKNIDITALIANVTPDQIGAAHKVFGPDNKAFYLVENSQGLYDNGGQLLEYKVTYTEQYGFQCTCEAGKHGFAHCKNFCWHVRASVAASEEEKAALKEQEAFQRQDTMVVPAVKVAVKPIEEVLGVPSWILTTRVAPHMKQSPREF